jgi:hypothetical protein
MSAPSAWAAGRIAGVWTAHCPPPEGTKKLTIPAEMKTRNGSVRSEATESSTFDIVSARPEPTMIPMMPA